MPNPTDPNTASIAILDTATTHVNYLATLQGPLSPGQCEALARLIAATQAVYIDKCPTV